MTFFEIKAKVTKVRMKAETAAAYMERQGWSGWIAERSREVVRELNALENDLAQMEEIK